MNIYKIIRDIRKITFIAGILFLTNFGVFSQTDIDKYNVVWLSPGKNASDSMPIGNGEVGVNLWVQEDDDLQFYISRTDAWSEACRLLKLGKIRIGLSPNPFVKGLPFKQELKLKDGIIEITAGEKNKSVKLTFFVDAMSPVIYLKGESESPVEVTATFETWRTSKKILKGTELESSWTMHSAPENITVWESPDFTINMGDDAIVLGHRNENSIVPFTIKHQGLDKVAGIIKDPLLYRTFGCYVTGKEFRKVSPTSLRSVKPAKNFVITIATLTAQTDTLLEWEAGIKEIVKAQASFDKAKNRTTKWWNDFWNRSWIFVEGDEKLTMPINNHPLRIGCDSTGGSKFRGLMAKAAVYDTVLDDKQIEQLAHNRRDTMTIPDCKPLALWAFDSIHNGMINNKVSDNLHAKVLGKIWITNFNGETAAFFENGYLEVENNDVFNFARGFSLEAWILPATNIGAVRIFDKVTAGVDDGFLFDTYPGRSLRLLVGGEKIIAKDVLAQDTNWVHVAATFNPSTGEMKIYLNGKPVAANLKTGNGEQFTGSLVTRAYILQRWILACGGRGNYPIKFNGSIFTVDPEFAGGPKLNPDWRRWGDCYWWQNTRLPYFAMIASGDFDTAQPVFDSYLRNIPVCRARSKIYYDADGVYFPETMTIFGMYSNRDYGWNRNGKKPGDIDCMYWRYAWQQGLELVTLMLDYYDWTLDDKFLNTKLIPMAREVLLYFDTRFKRDANGKLVISPAQAVETYWYNVTNDTPTVAGLHAVVNRLDKIKDKILPPDRNLFSRIKESLPPIPVRSDGQKTYILPAQDFDPKRSNIENPELYPIWPYRLFSIGKTNLETGIETFKRRHEKSMIGWSYDGQCAAILGLTEEAKRQILFKVRNSNPNFRFPAMWGPNYDWVPDQDHGSNIMIVLQNMLMFDDGEKIHLFPAFPKDWNARFKLHASKNTVVECEYRDGKVTRLKITPESRKADLVIHN